MRVGVRVSISIRLRVVRIRVRVRVRVRIRVRVRCCSIRFPGTGQSAWIGYKWKGLKVRSEGGRNVLRRVY